MKRTILAILTVALIGLAPVADAATWKVDAAHSSFGFDVRHMVVSKTRGNFTDFEGSLEFDGENISKGKAQVTVQVASIDTDNANRDDHLRSGDFFAVEEFPTMTFVSKTSSEVKDGKFQLTGDLTIHGVTREVTFDAEFHGVVTGMRGMTRTGFSAEATINRQDYGLTWSKVLETGGLVVGDNVNITAELEFVRQDEQAKN
jgi:polyisoprenoid-binding protein YceI